MSGSSRRTLLQGAAGGLATHPPAHLVRVNRAGCRRAGFVQTPGSAAASLPCQHVHAVGRDPGNGKLYLATHDGLFRYDPTGPTTIISTQEQAEARGFSGSAAFLLDGRDPFVTPGAAAAVACRVYQSEIGPVRLPDTDALVAALRSRS